MKLDLNPQKKRKLETENHVKALVKDYFDSLGAWSYAPIQNGLGVHGIHDRIACVPVVIQPWMVGLTIGCFASVECKKPGRRGEHNRGLSAAQFDNLRDILGARGASVVCDGYEDLLNFERLFPWMTQTSPKT